MNSMKLRTVCLLLATAGAIGTPVIAAASCGSAFCTVNTNWDVQGMATQAGATRFDLRYEYINQNKLRAGTRHISADQDTGDVTEIKTVNRNWVATLDYAFDEKWGVSVVVPWVARDHGHIADPTGAATFEQWNFSELSDLRMVGRYQFASAAPGAGQAGVQLGLKLPTGDYRVANVDGAQAERTLQPGTGSTDLIVGAYYSRPSAMQEFGWFVHGDYQRALATRDGFRPGDQFALTGGVTYPVTQQISLLAQLNALHKDRDSGINAEPDLSGGNYVYLSPGASIAFGKNVQGYAFLQVPVYQNVRGVQLTADYAVVAGVSTQF